MESNSDEMAAAAPSFMDEVKKLLDMAESEVGDAWQQLKAQAGRVRGLIAGDPPEAASTADEAAPEAEPGVHSEDA